MIMAGYYSLTFLFKYIILLSKRLGQVFRISRVRDVVVVGGVLCECGCGGWEKVKGL